MIQDLPLLPAEWTGWDWTLSNGTATAEQTQTAYNAVLNQGQCSAFSRFVWNDIVDCLALALEAAGIGWNDKYCSAEACKINIQYGVLTAAAFNSVRYNIDRFGIVHWTWASIPAKEGYIGRTEVRGVSTYGSASDKVYGWYMIELTKRLNTLLEVLKNTADFSELENFAKAESLRKTDLGRGKSEPLSFAGVDLAKISARANKIVVRPIYTSVYTNTKGIYEGKGIPSAIFESWSRAMTPYNAEIIKSGSSTLNYKEWSCAIYEAQASRIKTGIMNHSSKIAPKVNAFLRDAVFIAYLRNKEQAKSYTKAELEYYGSSMAEAMMYAQAKAQAELIKRTVKILLSSVKGKAVQNSILDAATPKNLAATDQGLSLALGNLNYTAPERLEAMEDAYSHILAYSDKQQPKPMRYQDWIRSYQESSLQRFRAILIGRYIEAESVSNAALTKLTARKTEFAGQAKGIPAVKLNGVKTGTQGTEEQVRSITNGVLNAGVLKSAEVKIQEQSISLAEGDKLQAKYAESVSAAESVKKAKLVSGTPKPEISTEVSESFGQAEIHKTESKRIETQISTEIFELMRIAKCQGMTLKAVEKIQTYMAAELGVVSAKSIRAIAKAESASITELSKDTEDIWKVPLQNGSDLYIRSVHPQWQEGSTVHMDSGGVFYEADQTETNVYIRSVDSMKGV